jgi:hypothetical protein
MSRMRSDLLQRKGLGHTHNERTSEYDIYEFIIDFKSELGIVVSGGHDSSNRRSSLDINTSKILHNQDTRLIKGDRLSGKAVFDHC